MYIRVIDEKHEYYGLYFDIVTNELLSNYHQNLICNIDKEYISFKDEQCRIVSNIKEIKKAEKSFYRFKKTFLTAKELKAEFYIYKGRYGERIPAFKYGYFSFCFYPDTERWKVFHINNESIKYTFNNKQELLEWIHPAQIF